MKNIQDISSYKYTKEEVRNNLNKQVNNIAELTTSESKKSKAKKGNVL